MVLMAMKIFVKDFGLMAVFADCLKIRKNISLFVGPMASKCEKNVKEIMA